MALKQNIIYIYFKGKHLVTSKSQYQYNHGQYLYFADLNLPQAFEVHFSNKDKGESKTQIGSNKLVEIPDEYFWSGASQIYAWVYLHSEINDGETIYEIRIPLIKRAKPTDEEPLPQQESAMERAIAELNNAVEITTENANKTEEDKTQVSNIKDEIIDLKEDIDGTADTVNQKAQEAIDASVRSENSAQHAAEYESGAQNYSQQAEQSAQRALESEGVARQKAQVATDASAEALGYRDEALDAKNKAEQAKQNIVDYRDETKGYRDETLNIKNDVQTLKGQIDETASDVSDISVSVKADAQSASNSADAASQSANSADQSAESASLSESKARQSEINAYNSANDASQSAEQARQFKNQSETNASHYPKIVNGFWYVWDASNNEFKNTDVDAHGLKGDKGDKGDTGNGIASTVLNSDYTLTITFTDGTTYKSQSIRGEKGLKGDKGDTGNGIASTVLNNDYTLTITFTDGTSYTTPSIRGQQGEKGDKGDVGESGVYIGADEPQDDDIKVWIDTDEAGTEADLIQDVVDLKEENKKIIANLATDTASGAVASFSDGADDLPLKSLVVDINPVQDLHGQDAPYPAGGGKNKFDVDMWITLGRNNMYYSVTDKDVSVIADDVSGLSGRFIQLVPNTQYTISFKNATSGRVFDDTTTTLVQFSNSQTSATFTTTESGQVAIKFYSTTYPHVVGKVQIELGSTPTAWSPYENLCHISGWTEVSVEQRGVNLLDESKLNDAHLINCFIDDASHPQQRKGIAIYLPSGTYRFTCWKKSVASAFLYLNVVKNDGTFVRFGFLATGTNYTTVNLTLSDDEHILFFDQQASQESTQTKFGNYNLQLELGSTATEYSPYAGRSITINLGQTVYGGHLDVLSGVLTVYPYYASYNGETLTGEWISDRDKYVGGTTPTIGAQVVNIGAQGLTVQLSPNQLNSLYGVNNIWADSGDTEVKYRADTSLYVKRKITEAIAALS